MTSNPHFRPFTIIVKGSPLGAEQIVNEYGEAIKGNASYFIDDTTLFGVQKPYQIFKDFKHADYLTLFFDCANASDRITTLMKKINREKSRLVSALATYKDKLLNYYSKALKLKDSKDIENLVKPELPKVSDNLKDFLSIKANDKSEDCKPGDDKSLQYEVVINTENFQNAINKKGLYCILSSEELSPSEIDKLYSSRSSSEIQYKIFKTELGYGATRIHFTSSLYSKFAVGFISSIIRYQMQLHARSIDQSTTNMIREMNMLSEIKINDVYTFSHIENKRQLSFLEFFGCSETLIDKCVKEDNDRIAGRRPTPGYRKPGPKPKDKANKNRSAAMTSAATLSTEVSAGAANTTQQAIRALMKPPMEMSASQIQLQFNLQRNIQILNRTSGPSLRNGELNQEPKGATSIRMEPQERSREFSLALSAAYTKMMAHSDRNRGRSLKLQQQSKLMWSFRSRLSRSVVS